MLWFIFCKSDILLQKLSDGVYKIPEGDCPPIAIAAGCHIHNITPMDDGTPVRTYYADENIEMPGGFEKFSLRESFHKLSLAYYQKAGKCEEILYWDSNTRFCGVCGAPMELHTDISKKCTSCGKEVWPQLATAVITLIRRQDEIMLVQARNFRGNYYGLVAGFVETGESLEEAVVREIKEEVGIDVSNLKYVMSQPWPYPCGLMVGFTAEYVGGEIRLQEDELAEGGWFKKDNLPAIPDKMSLARMMIDAWKEGKI